MSGRVCVIGAGISGLVTAKVFSEDGFDVTVFEKDAGLGGVWTASRTYPGLHANNARESYAFSDFPYPADTDDFPSAPQIRAYLETYAERFGVRPRIRLRTEVVRIAPAGDGWEVTVRSGGGAEMLRFDFVVVCSGVFSEPFIPEVEGAERFAGGIVHSSAATNPALFAGRRVVVVGGGKSALDVAAFAGRAAASCTLVFRRAYWMMPRYLFGRLRSDWLLLARVPEGFFRYHRLDRVEAALHGIGQPLVRVWWRGFCYLLPRLLGMPPELTPDVPLPAGIESAGIAHGVYELTRAGRIRAVRGNLRRFVGGPAIELDTGETLAADLVVCATGWRQRLPFLDEGVRAHVWRDGAFRLYRMILPPDVPRLGFVGYNSSTACQLTSEIAAHWLAQCFRGELHLPGVAAMEEEIDGVHAWLAEVMPGRREGYFVGPYLTHYLDELVRDMGLSPRRTSNFLAEYVAPVWATRYRTLGEERRRVARGERARPVPFYLSAGHGLALATLAAAAWFLWW